MIASSPAGPAGPALVRAHQICGLQRSRSCDSQGQGTARRSRAVWPCGGSRPVSAGAVAGPAVLGLASAAGDGGRRRPAGSRQEESSLLRTFAYYERSPTTNIPLLRTFAYCERSPTTNVPLLRTFAYYERSPSVFAQPALLGSARTPSPWP
jgi:hypothetical protein